MHALAAELDLRLAVVLEPRTRGRRAGDAVRSVLSGRPYAIEAARSRALLRATEEMISGFRPHVVQAELLGSAPYLEPAIAAGLPTVYSAHNVESRILAGPPAAPWSRLRRLAARRTRRAEERWAAAVDAVVAVSRQEAEWLRRAARQVAIVPNAVDLDRYRFRTPSARSSGELLFLGHLGYPPNRDAARRLAREVLPRVRRSIPDVRCVIAGARPPRRIRALAGPGVEVIGDVEDSGALLERAALLVCPLRWGAGSRIKLLEAAASGLPIVATSFSAEGLRLEAGRDFIAAESDRELAAAAIELLGDAKRRQSLADGARAAVSAHHSWSRLTQAVARLYEQLAARRPAATSGL